MAAHTPTDPTVILPVAPDQPESGWPAWLRDIARTVNHVSAKTTELAAIPPGSGAPGPAGPAGPAGPTGATGPAGSANMSGMAAGQIPIAATATSVTSSANLSGDLTSNATLVTTLATVNSNVGTFQGITVNGKGLVTAAANQNYAPLASPAFTGTPSLPTGTTGVTQAAATSNTSLATTAYVKAQTPLAPYFSAGRQTSNQSLTSGVEAVVIFNTSLADSGTSGYSTSTGTFTPTVAGTYFFTAALSVNATFSLASDNIVMKLQKNTSTNMALAAVSSPAGALDQHISASVMAPMNGTTDTFRVVISVTGTTPVVVGNANNPAVFSAFRVGTMTLLDAWVEPRPPVRLRLPRVEVRLPLIEEVAERWHLIAPMLRRATVRTGCYEPIDLLNMAMRGQVGIWVCEVAGSVKAAIVTQIEQYPRKRVLEVMFLGGTDLRDWLEDARDALTAHAEQAGCAHLATLGRPGWQRVLGARRTGDVVLVRELKGKR